MQAQNAAEREKSKKDGQHAAPPARSETGRLGIPKEFIDLFLEHNSSYFTFAHPRKPLERYPDDAYLCSTAGNRECHRPLSCSWVRPVFLLPVSFAKHKKYSFFRETFLFFYRLHS